MKKIILLVLIVFGIIFAVKILFKNKNIDTQINKTLVTSSPGVNQDSKTIPLTTTVMENLDTPWSIVFLPDNKMLVTERNGRVTLDGKEITRLNKVKEIGEGGLLGAAIFPPEFKQNNYIYFYYTYDGGDQGTFNRLVRMKLENNQLFDEKIIIDSIPGASNHNGGRIKFGPDEMLYITTGDAQNPSQAQDRNSFSGKILRLDKEEKISIYSYGHRNPQGLAWNDKSEFYSTEHGRSGILSGLDEFNKIDEGNNYGWPDIEGDEIRTNMIRPLFHSGSDTWAPGGLAYLNGSFYFTGLRGQALYKVTIIDGRTQLNEYFKYEFGRIRDVVIGPDNMIYISTSNLDGRGNPKQGDDKIIRINPEKL